MTQAAYLNCYPNYTPLQPNKLKNLILSTFFAAGALVVGSGMNTQSVPIAVNQPIQTTITKIGICNYVNKSENNHGTVARGIEYTEASKIAEAAIWTHPSTEAITVNLNEFSSPLKLKQELHGQIECAGELELPLLEVVDNEVENFNSPIEFKKELIATIDLCGELELPPLE